MAAALREVTLRQLLDVGIDLEEAARVAAALGQALLESGGGGGGSSGAGAGPSHLWRRISKSVLQPDHPFALHKLIFQATYSGWNAAELGPPPAWVPTVDRMAATNAARFMASWQGHSTWQQLK
jgi:acetyl-CoA synthetase